MISITKTEYGELLAAVQLQMLERQIEVIKDLAGEFINYSFYRQIWSHVEIYTDLPLLQKDNYTDKTFYFAHEPFYKEHCK